MSTDSYFAIELPSCLIIKKKTRFCYGISERKICFAKIIVSCDFFSAAVQQKDFLFFSAV